MRQRIHLMSIFAALVSSILVFSGVAILIYSKAFERSALTTTGTVLRLDRSLQEGTEYEFPIYQFTDAQGKQFTVRSNMGWAASRYQPGASVPVIYKRNDPANAMINDFATRWGFGLGFTGISSFMFIAGLIGFALTRPRQAK